MQKNQVWRLRWQEWHPWVAGVLVVLSSAWFADSLRDLFEDIRKGMNISGWIFGLFYFIVLIGAIIWLYKTRKMLFQPRTRHLEEHTKPEKRQYLILFLSNLFEGKGDVEGIPEWLNLTDDIENDVQVMEKIKVENPRQQWRWEMPLRAIKHHTGTLKQVVLVCSDESIKQAHWFYQVVRRYLEFHDIEVMVLLNDASGAVRLTPCTDQQRRTGGWDFEQFNSLATAIRELFKLFHKLNIPEKQVMIDFTGGPKVSSVVAVAVTFNRDASAQYVQTNNPWEVKGYDVEYGSADTGGVGI